MCTPTAFASNIQERQQYPGSRLFWKFQVRCNQTKETCSIFQSETLMFLIQSEVKKTFSLMYQQYMKSASLKEQACSPNCTAHVQYQERVSQKTIHPFLNTEGSPKSCIITALLLNILGLPFATCASCHPEAGWCNAPVTSDLVLLCHHSSPEQPPVSLHQTAACTQNKVTTCET